MAVNKIPLFRIPFLALRIILQFYSLHDIIQLSFCSKRSLRVAKQCWKKKILENALLCAGWNPRIILNHDEQSSYRFLISKAQDLHNQQTHNIRIGDAVVPSIHKGTETVTFWEDKHFGIVQVVSYIKDLFDLSIHSIVLKSEEYPNEFIHTINYVMSRQKSIKECRLYCGESNDDCLTHLLDNCKITENLWIYGGPSDQFNHNWNIHFDSLQISNGTSLTLQNLMSIDCKYLGLSSSSLTSEDLNQFLKNWQNGGSSQIKFVSIVMRSINRETVTSGIDTVSQTERLHRQYESTNKFKIDMYGGLDIQKNDGTIGTIFFSYPTCFQFGVDPEVIRRPNRRE